MPTDPNQRATTVKNQDIAEISVACWKNSENKLKIIKIIPETKTVPPIPLTRTVMPTTTTKTMTKLKNSQKLSTHLVRHVGKQTTPQKNATFEPMQPIDRLPGIKDRKDKIRYQGEPIKVTLMKLLNCSPQFKLTMPRLHSGAAIERPETTHLKVPPFQRLSGSNPRRLTYLIYIKKWPMKLIKIPTRPNLNRELL